MTIYETMSEPRGGLPIDDVVSADSLCRTLLSTVSGTAGASVARTPLLGRRGQAPPGRRGFDLARDAYAEAVPHDAVGAIDTEAIAEWIVGHYQRAEYPSVLLGSPHGSAAHLAVELGAAWLPTSVPLTVTWPGGSVGDWQGALEWGADLARLIIMRNPSVTVRQVHDPVRSGPLCGATVRFHLRWVTLPAAYERFLRTKVAAGGSTLLMRDLRTWPVTAVSARHGFQVGSPVGGGSPEDYSIANPQFRRILESLGAASWAEVDPDIAPRYSERSGEPSLGVDLGRLGPASHRLLYARPETLSACVGDLLREWRGDAAERAPISSPDWGSAPADAHEPRPEALGRDDPPDWLFDESIPAGRRDGRAGDRAVIECGRLFDPWQVRASGLIPYWCESAGRSMLEGAELWLAGGEQFGGVTVLPEPPGHVGEHVATLAHWRSLSLFARTREPIDRFAASRYPMLPFATGHATRMLGSARSPLRPAMPMAYAVDRLQQYGSSVGMLFT